jgi:hypothetical protein
MALRTIPGNYNTMDGKIRNFIETAIFDGLYIFFIYILKLPLKYDMYIALGLIPITVFCIMGIEGQSVTKFLSNYIRFMKRRRVLSTPSPEYLRERNKDIMLKKAKKSVNRKELRKHGK